MSRENKKTLRKMYVLLRDNLSVSEREEKSEKIMKTLLLTDEYLKCGKVFTYINMRSEVITETFIKAALSDKKRVAVPKSNADGTMTFIELKDFKNLETTALGTKEPVSGEELIVCENSLIIIPGTVFDLKRNRIGYGKGFYDRFLSVNKAKNVALAFDIQIAEQIPADEFDIPVDKIITESRIIR